jgi:hypothetical protein
LVLHEAVASALRQLEPEEDLEQIAAADEIRVRDIAEFVTDQGYPSLARKILSFFAGVEP